MDPDWESSLRVVCGALAQAPERLVRSLSVTLALGDTPGEALALSSLGQRLAVEYDLDSLASLSGHALTIRLSRPAGQRAVSGPTDAGRRQVPNGQ